MNSWTPWKLAEIYYTLEDICHQNRMNPYAQIKIETLETIVDSLESVFQEEKMRKGDKP